MHYFGVWQHLITTIVDIRDSKLFIYVGMPLYPSISISYAVRPNLYYVLICKVLRKIDNCTLELEYIFQNIQIIPSPGPRGPSF